MKRKQSNPLQTLRMKLKRQRANASYYNYSSQSQRRGPRPNASFRDTADINVIPHATQEPQAQQFLWIERHSSTNPEIQHEDDDIRQAQPEVSTNASTQHNRTRGTYHVQISESTVESSLGITDAEIDAIMAERSRGTEELPSSRDETPEPSPSPPLDSNAPILNYFYEQPSEFEDDDQPLITEETNEQEEDRSFIERMRRIAPQNEKKHPFVQKLGRFAIENGITHKTLKGFMDLLRDQDNLVSRRSTHFRHSSMRISTFNSIGTLVGSTYYIHLHI
jgi:hypothetical protein